MLGAAAAPGASEQGAPSVGRAEADCVMTRPPSHNVTELLRDWSRGDRAALDKLVPVVYDELRRQAARYMRRESVGNTLQTTAVVHEAYLRLVDQNVHWQSRSHFFGVAAQMMRRILVDHARSQQAAKRGGASSRLPLEEAEGVSGEQSAVDVLALDEALSRLSELDPQQGRIVELRYFAGMGIEETAEVLGISPATVKREWSTARAWLRRELSAS
jgi:RNA polymerase sigma-70 factor, ECF subfamily